MQIAVIGWGSLIWCPGCLQIKSRWHSDGPALPIEFARISCDKRLTLVIHHGSPEEPTPDQQTYWALMSEFNDPKAARENLQAREGAKNLDDIHSVTTDGQVEGAVDPAISARIRKWLDGRQNLKAAIWTGLPTNWPKKRDGKEFTREDAVAYLRKLECERDQAKATYDRAHEYVSNAPRQIQTPVRRMMREKKGWKDAELSAILFE
jgi:hypothetical protein